MPPIVTQPRLLQVVPHYDLNTDIAHNIANVLWFQSNASGTPSLANLQAVSNIFNPNWASVWGQYGSSAKHYIGCVVTDFSSTLGLTYDSRGGFTPVAGGQGVANPAQVAALISMSNGERYRGGHFRIYLPWVGDGALATGDSNNLSSLTVSNITNGFNVMITNMAGSGILGGQVMMLYRHRTDPVKAALFGIHSFTVQTMLATQRRRLRKIPRHKKKV